MPVLERQSYSGFTICRWLNGESSLITGIVPDLSSFNSAVKREYVVFSIATQERWRNDKGNCGKHRVAPGRFRKTISSPPKATSDSRG